MTNDEFKSLLTKAGFKTKRDFGTLLGLHANTTTQWGKSNPYPSWLKQTLTWAIKAKKYDELKNALKSE